MSRYTIREEIACGSTATVFLAEDGVLRRKVALKKLHPHLLNHSETVKRFEKEAVAVAMISHENIIRVYDYGSQDRNLYLAMEYVDGCTLESLLAGTGTPLPALVCLSVFHQLMRGLDAAHALGIVHRDVKPSNLLVDRNGLVRIADFGIAFLAEEKNITKTGAYLGTPVYSAPEQALCRPATDKSDIFSSGILFYRCLTGKLPFDGENSHAILASILEKAPANPSLINPRMLPGFSELVLAMLAKNPALRPTAAECRKQLEALAERHCLPIDAGRIRRFIGDGREYAGAESRELSRHFLDLACQAERRGQTRQAVKLAALAEIHGPIPAESRQDIRRIEASGAALDRRRLLAASLLAALALASLIAVVWAWRKAAFASAPAVVTPAVVKPAIVTPAGAELRPIEGPGRGDSVRAAGTSIPPAGSSPAGAEARPGADAFRDAAASPAAAAIAAPIDRRAETPPARRNAAPPDPSEPAQVPVAEERAPAARGFLVVKTNPPFAKVSLDGRVLGVTPFPSPQELPAGAHELLVEREGCLPATSRIVIEPGVTSTLRLALDRAESASR